MRDPYAVLGVPKGASEAEIKNAFRRLAKEHHPDRSKDDPRAKERFAEANGAYEILGDAAKRAQFDRGEIGADGKPRFQGFEGFGAGAGRGRGGFEFDPREFGRAGGFDPSDLFSSMFGGRGAAPGAGAGSARRGPEKGRDLEAELTVTLAEIAERATKRLRVAGGREVDVTLPANATDGKVMRLRGLGQPSPFGGEPGDVLLTLRIAPDPRFTIEGRDLRTRVTVPLADAMLGGQVRVPTLQGEVEMTLPPLPASGKSLRLRGKGLPGDGDHTGDLYVTIDVALPQDDEALKQLMRTRRG
jgi:DnaJ-class molecular chaperone